MANSLKSTPKHIILSAGGTGGHVMPALEVAKALKEKGYSVSWIGTAEGLEASAVPEAGILLDVIPNYRMQGHALMRKICAGWRLLTSIFIAFKLIKKNKAALVIGLGGYVSAASGVAAKLALTPLVIHEQNALAGRTNRYLARVATKVLCAFPETFSPSRAAIVLGNPLRQSLFATAKKSQKLTAKPKPLNLIILGGSLGAQIFNEVVPEAISLMPDNCRPALWHQTGEKTYDIALKRYQKYGIKAKISPFIKDMKAAYGFADIILCRAGALTISELCLVGLPAIFVPYPYALDDHQRINAERLVSKGASLLLPQSEFTPASLADRLSKLTKSPEILDGMAKKMLPLAKPNSTKDFVDVCHTLLSVE